MATANTGRRSDRWMADGFMLPAVHTGSLSVDLAKDLFRRLGCRNLSIAIKDAHKGLEAMLEEVAGANLFAKGRP